jgi:hypothetical protein
MTISLKHSYQSAVPDGGDTGLVQPSDWNAEHAITMATNKVLGRATAGTGAVEELSVTGSGDVVLATSPTLVTPALGTPSSGVLTNCTGLPTVLTANEATDTTCFINFTTAASGELGPKTNANLTFNSNTGVLTSASSILTTTDINGGTVDGTVIGGASAAAGTFTTATATQAVITQGTITDPALNISSTVTWNDAADTFTGWKLNVTNTASAAASLLMDLQVGGSSVFNVGKTGIVSGLQFGGPVPSSTFIKCDTNFLTLNVFDEFVRITNGGKVLIADSIAWTNNGSVGSQDTTLSRAAAGVVQVGTTAANALGQMNMKNLLVNTVPITQGSVTATATMQAMAFQ